MIPQPFAEVNLTLNPAPGTEDTVFPLKVHNNGSVTTSCWLLDPSEMEEIMKTGRVYVQVVSGHTSPPISVHVHKPFVQPSAEQLPDPEQAARRIASGQCPACRSRTGLVTLQSIMYKKTLSWQGEQLAVKVEHAVPYSSCADCGMTVSVEDGDDPEIAKRLDKLVSITEQQSGVPRKSEESVSDYNSRVRRILGEAKWLEVFEEVKRIYTSGGFND